MIGRIGILMLGMLCLLGCSSKKVALEGSVDKGLTANTVIRNHYRGQPDFKTLSGKIKIDYDDGSEVRGLNLSFRMEKDAAIWLSAPLGVVKAFITPEQVSFYNKLENEYFEGDFSFLSKYLGIPLDFEKVQNLLLGQAVFDLRDGTYKLSDGGGTYQLQPARDGGQMKTRYNLDPVRFLLAVQQLSQPTEKRLLEIRYASYQMAGPYPVPEEVNIIAIQEQQRNLINLSYRNLEADRELRFPYRVPDGYERIVLK